MANINIPSSIIDVWEDAMDAFLDDIPITCTICYPPKHTACADCTDNIGQKPSNINLSGRPVPFNLSGNCPTCKGDGFIETEVTETISCRVYFVGRQQIKKLGVFDNPLFGSPSTVMLMKSYIVELPKLLNAAYIRFDQDEKLYAYRSYKFSIDGEPLPHGFRHNRYILTAWKRKQD